MTFFATLRTSALALFGAFLLTLPASAQDSLLSSEVSPLRATATTTHGRVSTPKIDAPQAHSGAPFLADCTNGQFFEQLSATNVANSNTGGQELGQSFTASCTGRLETVVPVINRVSNPTSIWSATMRIYNGAGTQAVNQIGATPFSFNNASGPGNAFFLTITLDTPINIVQGQVYTWFMDMTQNNTAVQFASTTNPYAGGALYFTTNGNPASAGVLATSDIQFALDFLAPLPPPSPSTITATGYHVFAPAAAGLTIGDLAALNGVVGIPGYADPLGKPNIWTDYDGTNWIPATGAGEVLELGRAVQWRLVAVNNNVDFGSGSVLRPFPTVLSTTTPNTEPVTVSLLVGNDFPRNMLGNPFGQDLDVSGVQTWAGGENVGRAFLWNSALQGFRFDPNQVAAPWQAFYVKSRQTATATSTLTIPTEAIIGTAAQAAAQARRATSTEGYLRFDLDGRSLTGAPLSDGALALVVGPDAFGESKTRPLGGAYVAAGFSGAEQLDAIAALRATGGSVELPIAVTTVGAAPELVLRWDTPTNLPSAWRLTLVDRIGGAEVDLSRAGSYGFDIASAPAREASGEIGGIETAEAFERFVLRIDTGDGALATTAEVAKLSLDAPYPNPFAGRAQVTFTMADAGAVRLSVFDALGREVAVLAEGTRQSGTHQATFDASRLAMGTYVVRLAADGQVLTQRATVVR